MATDRLSDSQRKTYWSNDHGYGLGIRAPKEDSIFTDFGWGGAAGAYLGVDRKHGLSIYYAQHMLSSPNGEMRNWIYHHIMAELFGSEEFENLIRNCVLSGNYRFTF